VAESTHKLVTNNILLTFEVPCKRRSLVADV